MQYETDAGAEQSSESTCATNDAQFADPDSLFRGLIACD
jgi:hypothetical protein